MTRGTFNGVVIAGWYPKRKSLGSPSSGKILRFDMSANNKRTGPSRTAFAKNETITVGRVA